MSVTVTHNQPKLGAYMRKVAAKELPFALAVSLTRTAKAVQKAEEREMERGLDRPKPFTKNSLRTIPAKKAKPVAVVTFKDRGGVQIAGRYLEPQVKGGLRRRKGFEKALIGAGLMAGNEYAVPGRGVRLDRYGNLSRAAIRKMIEGATQRGGGPRGYFVPKQGSSLPRGIYQRAGRGGRKLKLLLLFVTDRPDYRRAFRFYRVARTVATRSFPGIFAKEFDKAIRTSRLLQ